MLDYKDILNVKHYVISDVIIKELVKLELNINEFLLIMYFYNEDNKIFDLKRIKQELGLEEKDILEAFNNLTIKKLINIVVENKENGKVEETISLDGLFATLTNSIKNSTKETEKENIFDIFEREFNRSLSPIEYEIVNAWLDNNINEELILGALKEAIYNGVKNFRYIDKIIYEWGKKGFKTMDDVKKHLENKEKTEHKKELFDYDWLDDDEE